MAEFDINKVQGNDRFIAGGAVLFIVLAFFPWRSFGGVTFAGQNYGGGSVKLFGNGSYGLPKLSLLLIVIAGAIVIARLAGALDSVKLPAGVNLLTLAAAGAATVLLILQFVFGFKYSAHPGFGFYLGLLVSAAMTYFAYLNFTKSGEALPSQFNRGGSVAAPPPAAPPAPPVVPPPPAEGGFPTTGP